MSRIACIYIPRFELNSRLRDAPDLAGQPLLLVDVGTLGARVIEASAEAEALGVKRQMAMTRARALCPEAVLIPPDPAYARAERERVLTVLYGFGPVVGHDQADAFFISLQGLSGLHPDEVHLGEALCDVFSAQLSLRGFIAIADSSVTAWIVARAGVSCVRVVPPGEDETCLAELPMDVLPMDEEVVRLCRLLGLERVGELQRLPPGALARRFGKRGHRLHERARGRSQDLFHVEIPEQIEAAEHHLDQPTDRLDTMIFLHKHVLDRVLAQVARTRRLVAALEVTLTVADSARTCVMRVFRPAQPTLDVRLLLDLVLLWLNSGPAPDLVEAIVMRVIEVAKPTPRQLHLFERDRELASDALQEAVSRLVALFGRDAVLRPVLGDSYRPEARVVWRPAENMLPERKSEHEPPIMGSKEAAKGLFPPTLELLEPPLPITWRGDRLCFHEAGKRESWQRIVRRMGPHRVEGEWWDAGFRREYWLLALEEGDVVWVFSQGQRAFLHAFLD
ncbi:MAG: DNA polymerase Y family protein [Deltaproteobacteria bacterium]|nr:DNA polymerase Y family protein [Deltaproteobacteria bacterium]